MSANDLISSGTPHTILYKTIHVVQNVCMRKGKVKVKCTLVQALRLCTGRTAHRGSRRIAVLYRPIYLR
jgi:hypothetical protein